MGNGDKPATNSHSIDLNPSTIYMGILMLIHTLDLKSADLFSLINKLSSEYDFKEKKIVLVGWSTGTPVSLNFMKNYPDIKIDVNPQDNFGEVISGLDGIYRSTSFKPLSDELHAFFLGNSVTAPYEYRISAVVPYSLTEFYSTLNIPTLHIIGEQDIITDMEHSLYFASLGQMLKSLSI